MSSSSESPDRFSPDNALPPVQPPSASFILQLFFIPAVIVLIIVGVWLVFNRLAQIGNDPYAYIQALERNTTVRWQAAVNLADALRDPRNVDLKRNVAVAQRLAGILDREVETGRMDEDALKLRVYLCHALGEFQVPEAVLPVLLKTATTQRQEEERYVRFAALTALAVLMSNTPEFDRRAHPELLPVLLRSAEDDEPVIRSTAAFALGAYGGDEALARLERLLGDKYPDVRYNAATTLARHGNAAAAAVLIEMLNPDELAGVEVEPEEGSRDYKRATIYVNALRASLELARNNAPADLDALRQAVERLRASKLPASIDVQAGEVLQTLADRQRAG